MRVEIYIKQIRQEKNISLNELARLSGLSKGTLSKIERQEEDMKLSTLGRIAMVLNVDPIKLFKFTN